MRYYETDSCKRLTAVLLEEPTHITLVRNQLQHVPCDPQQVWSGRHDNVDQNFRHDGDERVLPCERIKQGSYGMDDLRQGAVGDTQRFNAENSAGFKCL